jgi:hypothetical protein
MALRIVKRKIEKVQERFDQQDIELDQKIQDAFENLTIDEQIYFSSAYAYAQFIGLNSKYGEVFK